MSIFEDTNPRALKDLLVEAHSHTMALPDFQRDFVWEPGATQNLIVSIANNYPAGSILPVRDTKRVFAAREFEGAPSLMAKSTHFWCSTASSASHLSTRRFIMAIHSRKDAFWPSTSGTMPTLREPSMGSWPEPFMVKKGSPKTGGKRSHITN